MFFQLISTIKVNLVVKMMQSAYRIYSNRRRGVYFIFGDPAAAFIRGRRLFEGGVYSKITLFSTKYRTAYGNFFTR